MTLRWKFAVVALVSLVIGAVGARMPLAQSSPHGYVIAEVEVTDPDIYETYLAKVTPVGKLRRILQRSLSTPDRHVR